MGNTEQLRTTLLNKLKELFQLDQPDLDFGFYRIMHARAKEVTEFIDHDLLSTIKEAFDSAGAENAEAELEAVKAEVATNFGREAFDADGNLLEIYAKSPLGKKYTEAQKKLADSGNAINGEDSVYYHLFRFFSRYYDNGDFVSMRYHTRETAGTARPYAIPYGGEEVMLHWANADQYYVKTSENFQNFTFDLTKSKDLIEQDGGLKLIEIPVHPMPVHFKIAEADEGEHGNIKSDDNKKRKFFLTSNKQVELNDAGELVVYFEFRKETDEDKISDEEGKALGAKYNSSAKGNWHLLSLTDGIITAAEKLSTDLKDAGEDNSRLELYLEMLKYQVPSEGINDRILLTKYLYKYTAANTSDYFIHKNLKAFLSRELDFYIKNEIMHLDEIMNSDAPGVENYLTLIKVFRKIAGKLIDFLGQLEDFQKKLWLKKKFVVQCDYCLTLDRVPSEFYDEIFANEQQIKEWEKLGIPTEYLVKPPTAQSNSGELFADANSAVKFHSDFLMVDTKFFPIDFKQRLLAKIENFDEQCDGLLIHSENFQALNLLQQRYKEQVKCVYIDPPYNTGEDGFPYKDAYQTSSWISMFQDRLAIAARFMNNHGLFACHMDEHEHLTLEHLVQRQFGYQGDLGKLIWDKKNPKGDSSGIAAQHEYVHFASNNPCFLKENEDAFVREKTNAPAILTYAAKLIKKAKGVTEDVRKEFSEWVKKSNFSNGEKAYCLIDDNGDVFRTVSMAWPNKKKAPDDYFIPLYHPITKKACPIPSRGWRNPPDTMKLLLDKGLIIFGADETTQPTRKYLLKDNLTENIPSLYYMGGSDDKLFKNLSLVFENPKPVEVGCYFIDSMTRSDTNKTVLDYFAGSGTTAHSTISLNRKDKFSRKYILVEMGEHFDTVLKPRIEKVVYSADWKDGKPVVKPNGKEQAFTDFGGISHCFKYIRLESYEDTLNNLIIPENDSKMHSAVPSLREDYALHYMLDTEAAASLLNIDDFADPFGGYSLNIKESNSDASVQTAVDLVETFNYLIGLRVQQYYRIQSYKADFKRSFDPELPANQNTRWEVAGKPEMFTAGDDIAEYKWRFQKIEGTVPANPLTPNDGKKKNILIVWRTLTGNLAYDNLMLDWYLKDTVNPNEKSAEYDIIYINGSNNIGANRKETDSYRVQLIEEEFLKRMWEQEEF